MDLLIEAEAKVWLAQHGYDPQMGARPMKRVIQEQIKRQLADDLLFGDLSEGGDVRVDLNEEGELEVKATPREKEQKALPASTS